MYDEASWIDAYAKAIGACKPELMPEQAVEAARQAFTRDGSINDPKTAATLDAVFRADDSGRRHAPRWAELMATHRCDRCILPHGRCPLELAVEVR
jgi:hypothetical protein